MDPGSAYDRVDGGRGDGGGGGVGGGDRRGGGHSGQDTVMHDAMMVMHNEVSGGAADEYNSPPPGAPVDLSERDRNAAADTTANARAESTFDLVPTEQSDMVTVSARHAPTIDGHDGASSRDLKRQLAELRGELEATR